MAQAAPNPFDLLPIETNQHIARYLEDPELCAYRVVCRSTHDAVDADKCSFWRRRFLATFEKPSWTERGNMKYKQQYQRRRKALTRGPNFDAALTRRDPTQIRKGTDALEVLRDLINDAFSDKKSDNNNTVYKSENLKLIVKFAHEQDLLDVIFVPIIERRATRTSRDVLCIPKQLLLTLQVLLAPVMLSLERNFKTYAFPISQQVVYGTAAEHPIFGGANGLDINMEWALHQLNFWKYHMCREAECTLFNAFEQLDDDEKPRFWNSQLKQGGTKLGTYWKGAYAYVDRDIVTQIRDGDNYDPPINDEFNGEGVGCFQDMRLEMVSEGAIAWPDDFEKHLHSLATPVNRAKTRAQRRSTTPEGLAAHKPINFQFIGDGNDATEEFFAQGWLNALPSQHGVPGWQRMTMMKYFEDPDTGAIDYEALWAYEGVVLPGAQIMVGRWWAPSEGAGEEMYSGPYILWCVDGAQHASAKRENDEDDLP